jgi:hypothetical protein
MHQHAQDPPHGSAFKWSLAVLLSCAGDNKAGCFDADAGRGRQVCLTSLAMMPSTVRCGAWFLRKMGSEWL